MGIVFVHGWGCDASYWDQLASRLSDREHRRIDLNFVDLNEPYCGAENTQPSVYVTHSLGTMWALKNNIHSMTALISINGFSCFKDHTSPRILKSMMLNLERKPRQQMRSFWDMCDLPHSETLNVPKLKQGLEWLMNWDLKTELENLACPVMSLVGRKDPILNNEMMIRDWGKYELHVAEDGGHSLPISHAQWCADKIKTFVDEL